QGDGKANAARIDMLVQLRDASGDLVARPGKLADIVAIESLDNTNILRLPGVIAHELIGPTVPCHLGNGGHDDITIRPTNVFAGMVNNAVGGDKRYTAPCLTKPVGSKEFVHTAQGFGKIREIADRRSLRPDRLIRLRGAECLAACKQPTRHYTTAP